MQICRGSLAAGCERKLPSGCIKSTPFSRGPQSVQSPAIHHPDAADSLHCNVGGEFFIQLAFEIVSFEDSTKAETQHISCNSVLTRDRASHRRPEPVAAICPVRRPVVFLQFSQRVVLGSLVVSDTFHSDSSQPSLSSPERDTTIRFPLTVVRWSVRG